MKNSVWAAAILMACASSTVADGRALMGDIMVGSQLAAASEGAARRDHLVSAAHAARRIVEDNPESPLAALLQGDGISVIGAAPIRLEGLQDGMIAACLGAPDVLCVTDWAYAVGERVVAPQELEILGFRRDFPDTQINTGGRMYRFRADAALTYARLGLDDRVRATVAYHVANDGKAALAERGILLPEMVIALAMVGDIDNARQLGPDFIAAVAAAPEWEKMTANFAPQKQSSNSSFSIWWRVRPL